MDPITGAVVTKGIQEVADLAHDALVDNSSSGSGDFENVLRELLSPNAENQVNEEELFAALIHERVKALKGEEAGTEFQQKFNEHKQKMTRSDGYVPVEDAAKAALGDLSESGTLSAEEGSKIRLEAFHAAQLDDNKNALYDGRGSADDPTIAVQDMESALAAARLMVEQFESGELSAEELGEPTDSSTSTASLGDATHTPSGNTIDGGNGFLWKPVSESDEKLVVLLPAEMTDQVLQVVLKDSNDETVEEGRSTGVHNGGREHFRFDKPGGGYPNDVTVEVTLSDGSVQTYKIPNPSERYD